MPTSQVRSQRASFMPAARTRSTRLAQPGHLDRARHSATRRRGSRSARRRACRSTSSQRPCSSASSRQLPEARPFEVSLEQVGAAAPRDG